MGNKLNALPQANSAGAEGHDTKALLFYPGKRGYSRVMHLNVKKKKIWYARQLVCFLITHSRIREKQTLFEASGELFCHRTHKGLEGKRNSLLKTSHCEP